MLSLSGKLLAASPRLGDPNFARAVILIVQHGQEGALGIVLNRPSAHRVDEVWRQVGGGQCAIDQPLGIGGPVEGPLVAVHGDAELSEREILPGVYFASQRTALECLIEHPTAPVRLFSGYSGWGEGQLESEVREGAWLTAPATAEQVFFEGDDLWKDVVTSISGEILHARGDIRHVPPEPWHN
jgi:putative transcriptional regulator